ncbi:MAG TPA: hypothetical protein VNU19_19265 [Candidatus Acidoferrum sp.]|nr:hypothetical protein [Candidatus Acidoferrum sp.]
MRQLVDRVRRQIPDVASHNGTSANDVKPIHVVRTFGYPGEDDDALVLSTMFTFHDGTLKVHCNLMRENGPILQDLGTRDLGIQPSEPEIEAVVAEVENFIGTLDQFIIAALKG